MIRILHVVSGMNRGGIETFLMNIYRKLDKSEYQFDFLVHKKKCHYDQEILEMGGRIFYISPRKVGIRRNKVELDAFFKEHKEYKIVHQHLSSLSYIEPLKIAKKNGVPVRIVHSHNTKQSGSKLHYLTHKINQNIITSVATHYFACSKAAAKWLYNRKQFNNNNYVVIKNAIDTEQFIFNEEKRALIRKELNLVDKLVVGHVGRFNNQKNHNFLIDIFDNVYKENKEAVLLLVGEGALKGEIELKVAKLNLNKSVLFTGIRSDINHILQAIDVFVMPSFHEGLPVTVVEAQAAGLPCLLSDTITNEVEVTGLVQWENLNESPRKWANTILNLGQGSTRSNMEKELSHEGYDISTLVSQLERIYSK